MKKSRKDMGGSKLGKHLGGHSNLTHIDRGALTWLHNELECQSFCDLGCGPGGMVEEALEVGFNHVVGIDGDFTIKRFDESKFIIHDFTKGTVKELPLNLYDVCWCVEFVEHVDEHYIPNYVDIMKRCKYVVMTHALPGKKGHHHVNCQEASYWIDKFKEYHLYQSKNLTESLRSNSTMPIAKTMREKGISFMVDTGMVFVNEKI